MQAKHLLMNKSLFTIHGNAHLYQIYLYKDSIIILEQISLCLVSTNYKSRRLIGLPNSL